MFRTFFAVCVVALAAVACRSGGGGPSGATQTAAGGASAAAGATATVMAAAAGGGRCDVARPRASGSTDETLISGGIVRRYILRVPPGYDGSTRLPVLYSFHGFAEPAPLQVAVAAFDPIADAENFIVVTPWGTGDPPRWNAILAPDGAADMAFIRDLMDALDASLCVDATRVYVAGYSNGGGMAMRVACDAPERVAAVALVSATYLACGPKAPLVAFHGTADRIVPYEGKENVLGTGIAFPAARRATSEWARGVGCDALATISRPAADVELSTYGNCPKGESVLLYTVLGGGHTWPGSPITLPENVTGPTTRSINASQIMWDFFKQYRLDVTP